MDSNRTYYPTSARLKIPATTIPDVPYVVILSPQAEILESVEIFIPQAAVLQDLGVRVVSRDILLYPAMGGISDSNFTGGAAGFGAMAMSGASLLLPFNRKLGGPPFDLRLEFYNDGAGVVSVNVIVITSSNKNRNIEVEVKKEAKEK